jgi:hypothetical protein
VSSECSTVLLEETSEQQIRNDAATDAFITVVKAALFFKGAARNSRTTNTKVLASVSLATAACLESDGHRDRH